MNARGFTLIELLVVMVVLGLVMAVAPLALFERLPGAETKAAARELGAAMRALRSESIRHNQPLALTVDLQARQWSAPSRPARSFPKTAEIGLIIAANEIPDDGVGRVTFYPDGTTSGGTITLSQGERRYHVAVDWLTGQVDVGE